MLYRKNLPVWERVLRSVAGVAMVAVGLLAQSFAGSPLGYIIAGAGVMTLATGFVGFGPACAMVGRRLK